MITIAAAVVAGLFVFWIAGMLRAGSLDVPFPRDSELRPLSTRSYYDEHSAVPSAGISQPRPDASTS